MRIKKCSGCGKEISTPSNYCKKCSSNYYKQYRLRKKEPNINLSGLERFIQKIKNTNYYIDFNDISTIIFFYSLITIDIYEYDKYSAGRQIKLMWDRILKYYNKKKYIDYETEN